VIEGYGGGERIKQGGCATAVRGLKLDAGRTIEKDGQAGPLVTRREEEDARAVGRSIATEPRSYAAY
jgi:hypothetical protein